MIFIWSKFLWALLSVPAVIVAYAIIMRRKKATFRYSSIAAVRDAMAGSPRVRRHVPPLLLLLAFTALIIAAARPVADVTALTEQRTIMLAIDTSMSMSADDVQPSRIAAAQAAAHEFIRGLPRDVRVGIVSFSGSADLLQVPTRNREHLATAIGQMHLDYNTAIGSGMVAALIALFPDHGIGENFDIFGSGVWHDGGHAIAPPAVGKPKALQRVPAGSYGPAAIIVMTDGKSMAGMDPRVAARMAADRGVRVYTVGFGTRAGRIVGYDGEPLDVQVDEETLKDVAQITRGGYFRADSAEGLKSVYEQLSPQLVLERNRETEMTAMFAAGAALLLVVSAALSMMWFTRLA